MKILLVDDDPRALMHAARERPDLIVLDVGLTIVRTILAAHHGAIDHVPRPEGALFRIRFRPAA